MRYSYGDDNGDNGVQFGLCYKSCTFIWDLKRDKVKMICFSALNGRSKSSLPNYTSDTSRRLSGVLSSLEFKINLHFI